MRDLVGICHDRPSEAHRSGFAISKLRFRFCLRLHGVVHNTPSPMADLQRRICSGGGGCGGGGIPMACGSVGSLEYFL